MLPGEHRPSHGRGKPLPSLLSAVGWTVPPAHMWKPWPPGCWHLELEPLGEVVRVGVLLMGLVLLGEESRELCVSLSALEDMAGR